MSGLFVNRYSVAPAPTLQQIGDKLHAGTAVLFDCFGDSTMFGADPENLPLAVAATAPAQFQTFLRVFYGNSAASVANRGINSTSIANMLAGTDGSGLTFDARIAATAATVIYCNHAMNTATDIGVTPDTYRADLMRVVNICQKYSKTLVLETPNPAGAFGITTPYWAERVRLFAEIMRSVARATGTPLVDNFYWCEKVIESGKYAMLQLLGDGIHPTQLLYRMKGQNMAMPIVAGGAVSFTAENQYLPCTSAQVIATAGAVNNIVTGKFGKMLSTGAGAGRINIAYVVDAPGLDIYMANIAWSSGATVASINDNPDTLVTAAYSSYINWVGTQFVSDHESCVVEDAAPGLRMLSISHTAGAVGFNFLRTRKTGVIKNLAANGATSNHRKTLLENYEFTSAGDSTLVIDELPNSTLIHSQEYELSATLGKNTGLVLHGLALVDQAALYKAIPAVVVGLDASGFLCIWEHDLTSLVKTVIKSAEDYSLVPRRWYIAVTKTTVDVIDYAAGAATSYAKIRPYYGGCLGFWKLAAGTQTIDKLVKLVR